MKTLLRKEWMLALLLAIGSLLAACGSAGGGQPGSESAGDSEQGSAGKKTGGIAGMDHSDMGHGSMNPEDVARLMVVPNVEYSYVAFIDAMVPHHEGAVETAQVALRNSEHEEIKRLSRDIISAQRAEIEQLGEIRQEIGAQGPPPEMSDMDMEMMGMTDPDELANQEPFDLAFIDAMIPHHQSAIAMAKVALEESNNPEIRGIAEDIVRAQEREISQMKEWRERWYPGD